MRFLSFPGNLSTLAWRTDYQSGRANLQFFWDFSDLLGHFDHLSHIREPSDSLEHRRNRVSSKCRSGFKKIPTKKRVFWKSYSISKFIAKCIFWKQWDTFRFFCWKSTSALTPKKTISKNSETELFRAQKTIKIGLQSSENGLSKVGQKKGTLLVFWVH